MGKGTPEIAWDKEYSNKNYRENQLAAIELETEGPEWIPCSIGFFNFVWRKHRDGLKEIVESHPFLFGKKPHIPSDYDYITPNHKVGKWTDHWGCGWTVAREGFEGIVDGNPIDDYDKLDDYAVQIKKKLATNLGMGWAIGNYDAGMKGLMRSGPGGRLFDRIYFLRGFNRLMSDIARNHPRLPDLIQLVQDVRMAALDDAYRLVEEHPDEHFIDIVGFHTDIGTQSRLMMRIEQFRKYIKPFYTTIFQRCRKMGSHVYLSSDGNLREIVDDLVECGCSVHDPQMRASGGIDGIKKAYLGKMCVDLDFDRQQLPYFTPKQIDRLIKQAVEDLNTENGGLMIKVEVSDDNVPLENIRAACDALEKYCILRK
ncbi:MAG: hypothetical protein ACFFCS_09960 [Candidatus Hodarchaeota archaeon]